MRDSGTPAPTGTPSLNPTGLDGPTAALVALAAAAAGGDEGPLADGSRAALAADVPPVWVDELILQSVLMVGYPRALVAAGVWRRVTGIQAPRTDLSFAETGAEWQARGEDTCRLIYAANYDRLRVNVRALHPALDAWMVREGYGRVLSRPGLDLARRELCTIAQIAVLRSPRQLHSHLRGALQAGATAAMAGAALEIGLAHADAAAAAEARSVWAEVRGAEERGTRP
jgi:4-carboxymuconolactone decarboxylase